MYTLRVKQQNSVTLTYLNPPILSISLSASWLLPTIYTGTFIEAYRLSTDVAMATNPSTTEGPPTEDRRL